MRKLLAALALLVLSVAPAAAPAQTPSSTYRADFERGLIGAPAGALYRAIKAAFPQEYEAMLTDMVRQAQAAAGDRAALARVGFDSIRGFYGRHLSDLVNAPAPALNAVNRGELAVVRALAAHDAGLCQAYALAGLQPGSQLTPDVEAALLAAGLAMVEAIRTGRGRPVDPARGQLGVEDATAWQAAMRARDRSEPMRRYLAGEATQFPTPQDGCRAGVAVYQAIADLPSEQSARVTAFVLRTAISTRR